MLQDSWQILERGIDHPRTETAPTGQDNEVIHAPLKQLHRWKAAAAPARLRAGCADVANRIAQQWHGVIGEARQ